MHLLRKRKQGFEALSISHCGERKHDAHLWACFVPQASSSLCFSIWKQQLHRMLWCCYTAWSPGNECVRKVRQMRKGKSDKRGGETKTRNKVLCVFCSCTWDAPSLDVCVWLHWADLGGHKVGWRATQVQWTGDSSCCSTYDETVHCFVLSNALDIQCMSLYPFIVFCLPWWVLKTGNIVWVINQANQHACQALHCCMTAFVCRCGLAW